MFRGYEEAPSALEERVSGALYEINGSRTRIGEYYSQSILFQLKNFFKSILSVIDLTISGFRDTSVTLRGAECRLPTTPVSRVCLVSILQSLIESTIRTKVSLLWP